MKRPLPTSIPSIIPAAVLAEAKKKNLVYVGTGDEKKDMFDPPVEGYRWAKGQSLKFDLGLIGFYKDFHFFLPRKTAAKFFDVPKAPKTRYFKGCSPTYWGRDVAVHTISADERHTEIFKDGKKSSITGIGDRLLKQALAGGSWIEISAAEAKAYLASFKKPEPDIEAIYKPYGKSAITKLTEENTLLKARVAKLEAAIRDANKAL